MAKITTWVRRRFGSKNIVEKRSADQLPFLSLSRRPITPTSFDTPACLFFQLPYDIRSMVLAEAFGGHTLHIDLAREEDVWQWRGTVCYRNTYEGGVTIPQSMRYAWHGPWNDTCMKNYERERQRQGKGEEEYKIGTIGFLLSCRQAYTEGIDVLYSANCIHIQSEPLLLQLPRLILPNRLSSITSLEIVITAHYNPQQNSRSSFNVDHLKPILEHIATYFHELRSLYLSFRVASHGREILNGPALPWIDAFHHSTQLREMTVELPSSDYWAALTSQLVSHPYDTPTQNSFQRYFWRSLDGEAPSVQYRSMERYPYPPLKLPGPDSVESAGYWLSEGDRGLIRPYCVCSIGV